MSKTEDKRQRIFDAYKANLNLLIDIGSVKGKKDRYICPICLKQHNDLNEADPLTLEDAPPKSLGGKANTLTCKSCNNTAGHKIDFHLAERLKELDNAQFLPGTEMNVKIKIGNETLQGTISVQEDGTMQIIHSKKNNHPEILEQKMKELKGGMVIDMDFLKSRVIPDNLEYALLKTGYMLAFEKFGYSFILDSNYDIVRQQLQNPEKRIYPEGFWLSPPYPKSMSGVYFIMDKGLECLLALFNLDTGKTERLFGTLLPLPIHPIDKVISQLNKKFEKEKTIELTLYPQEQGDTKYLTDPDQINAMYKWMSERKTSANIGIANSGA
jgi:hypothetical protein